MVSEGKLSQDYILWDSSYMECPEYANFRQNGFTIS